MLTYIFVIFGSFVISSALIYALLRLPLGRRLTAGGIPLLGGLAIAGGFFLTFFILINNGTTSSSRQLMGLAAASLCMWIFGIYDDWRGLSVSSKFLAQLISGGILIFLGIRTQIIFIPDALNILVTLLWVLGITNAFNHLDIADGITGLTSFIISISLLIIAVSGGQQAAALFLSALLGPLVAFLIFNFPPAKIYMGNSGSHFLGFILAALALFIDYAPLENKVALLSPILIFGYPIFDTLYLTMARLRQGKSPFKKSDDHLMLKILASGYSKRQALFMLLSACLILAAAGVFVTLLPDIFKLH